MAEREDLKNIGFNFNPVLQIYGYDVVKLALLMYKDLNSNMLVPLGFVVPASDLSWPKEIWGMSLGMIVSNIRCGYYYGYVYIYKYIYTNYTNICKYINIYTYIYIYIYIYICINIYIYTYLYV
jgi:hypothetical protein